MHSRNKNPEARMGVYAHLKELRTRLVLVMVGVGVGIIPGWFLYEPAMACIQRPLKNLSTSANVHINFQTIGAAFDLKLTVALWLAVLITSPWWIVQIGLFIAPALRKREKLYVAAFGSAGMLLFAAGAYSGILVAPKAVEVLQSFVPDEAQSLLLANSYVSFYMRLVIAFGVSFLIPEVLVALNFLGLMSAKSMVHGWRWATVMAFTIAAITNPLPSPWPMIVQAFVLLSLYLLAVFISWLHERVTAKRGIEARRRAAATSPGESPV